MRIRNFYGKKWPQQIAELPKLKEIDIDGKIGKKCSHTEIVEGLGKSVSLKKACLSFKLDFSKIGDNRLGKNALKSTFLAKKSQKIDVFW